MTLRYPLSKILENHRQNKATSMRGLDFQGNQSCQSCQGLDLPTTRVAGADVYKLASATVQIWV